MHLSKNHPIMRDGCAGGAGCVYKGEVLRHESKQEPGLSQRQTELLELLETSGARLHALLARLTLREDVAEELMQDLFIKLHGARDQGGIECWYAYARRTAINLAFDWRRRQARSTGMI